jgi:hypothetical protein
MSTRCNRRSRVGPGLGMNVTNAGSLGVCVDDVSESRTCSGSSRRIPQQVGESNILTTRSPEEPQRYGW